MRELAAYTPADMGADLAAGAAVVLPWVGAGVGGGLLLLLAFLGIRSGIRFFRELSYGRNGDWDRWDDADEARWQADMRRAGELTGKD